MIYPPSQKPPIWSIDPGVIAYNCQKAGMPHPVLAMPMWEGAGSLARDYSGHGGNGLFQNTPTWEPEGVLFNSTTEHIKGPNGAILNSKGTIIFGYKQTITPTDWYYWWVLDDDYLELAINAIASTGEVNFSINNSTINQVGCTWIDGAYHDVATTWNADSNERRMYDNGSIFMAANTAFTWDAAGAADHNLRIGGRATGANRYAGGIIYYFYVFNTDLSASQVKFLHYNPYFMYQIPEKLYGYTAAAPPAGNPFWYYNMLRRRN